MWFGRHCPVSGQLEGGDGDCRLPGGVEETHAAPLRGGGAAAAKTAFQPPPLWGGRQEIV